MDNFPSALIIASYDSVSQDNNALYRLVRPLQGGGGTGVQSTDRLVNVVPFRRKYTFERKEQLNEFGQQILKRPLVLQPVLHFGRGLGPNCALCYEDELWLVMVNQTHPKILSRLQMGLDSAKAALERGQPFEIRFRFGKLIQRVYREHLAQKEKGEAQKSSSVFNEYMTYFRYAEWEHCDLNLRYHGYGAYLNRSSALHSLPNLEMKWDFEDIGMHEMEWRQLTDQVSPIPHLSPVYEDEIRELLPGWTINTVSPLENIGDSIPENNYDYAQAGRLYASFRKKRRPRNNSHHYAVPGPSSSTNDYDYDEQYQGEDFHEELEGAVGFDPSVYPDFVDTEDESEEDDFGYNDSDKHPSQSRQRYDKGSGHHVSEIHNRDHQNSLEQHLPSNYDLQYSGSGARSESRSKIYAKSHSSNKSESALTEVQPDKHGHIHAKVKIISNAPSQHYQNQTPISVTNNGESPARLYETLNLSTSDDYHAYTAPFKKQDSDRFSRSTNADSGYCPDVDDNHSRGGSFDYPVQSYIPRSKHEYTNISHLNDVQDDYGLDNPAFRYNSSDMNSDSQKKEQVRSKQQIDATEHHNVNKSGSKSVHNSDYRNLVPKSYHAPSPKDSVAVVMKAPPRQKKNVNGSSGVPQVVESFI